ncbi:actin filament bundling protein [Perilla frutescens var. hirtella]|nr:actin filament bundling protein [Perilla frutescens var. hirtella]
MHVPKEQKSKLDSKSTPCIFVGYGDEEFGYRLWDPEKKTIVRNRDIPATIPEGGREEIEVENEQTANDQQPDVEQEEPPLEDPEQQLRRSERELRPSSKYPSSSYVLITDEGEPESFKEVQTLKDKSCWIKVMQKKMDWKKHCVTCDHIVEVYLDEVPFARSSLNHDDIFVLDTKSKIFQFNGSNSSIQERAKALEVVQYIKDTYHDGKCEIAAVEDGKLMADAATGKFWSIFGGFAPLPRKVYTS